MDAFERPYSSGVQRAPRLAGLAAALSALALSATALAAGSVSLDETLRAIQQERRAVSEENREREARFQQERNRQQEALNQARAELRTAETESARLEEIRNANARVLDDLKGQLAERQGEFGELFGAARAAAADLEEQLAESLVSAQFPSRREALRQIAQAGSLPTVDQLENLWFTLMQEASEQAKVVSFEAPVIGIDNQPSNRTVTRIGPFAAFSDGEYVVLRENALSYLARQPAGDAARAAARVESHRGDGYVAGVIDPSLGSLLKLQVELPTFRERVEQGGGIGYVIIAVLVFGVGLGLFKWATLTLTAVKVKGQAKAEAPSADNPLGRVMMVYAENRDVDIETLQLKLDDAVLKEMPRLEGGLNLLKVLAAVAPLMGLLGTVVGMIVTFQAITLFGTGDPKLMAGGISQALVTTVQGLVAAIPLLLLHTFAASASRRVAQTLEEQSAGMLAEYAERHA